MSIRAPYFENEFCLKSCLLWFLPIGRIGRFSYGLSLFFTIMLGFAEILVLQHFLNYKLDSNDLFMFNVLLVLSVGILFLLLISLIAFVMLCVKRLHDLGESGLWTYFILIPILNLVFITFLLLVPGMPYRNYYGIPPH